MAGAEEHWTLDKRIPLALIFAIVLQTSGFAFWVGTLSTRVEQLEAAVTRRAADPDRITRLEVRLETVLESVKRIERAVTAPHSSQ